MLDFHNSVVFAALKWSARGNGNYVWYQKEDKDRGWQDSGTQEVLPSVREIFALLYEFWTQIRGLSRNPDHRGRFPA